MPNASQDTPERVRVLRQRQQILASAALPPSLQTLNAPKKSERRDTSY